MMAVFQDDTVARVQRAGRFRVERELGRGAAGVVYQALDLQRDERVAIKCLLSITPAGLFRIKKEFRTLADLRHPNLVALHDLFVVDGMAFYSMELVDGLDFVSWTREVDSEADARDWTVDTVSDAPPAGQGGPDETIRGVLNVERTRTALDGLVRGVRALHAAELIHRDLKPSNVLVTDKGRTVILDFGLASARDLGGNVTATNAGGFAGTPTYMAPEQAGMEVGPAADWYGVGCMLYEALVGRPPFSGAPLQILMRKQVEAIPDPRAVAADAPADLAELVTLLGRLHPAERMNPSSDPRWAPSAADTWDSDKSSDPSAPGIGAAGTMTVRFVGRGSELTQLHLAIHRAPQKGGRFVVVQGEAGIGKSALITQALQQLHVERSDIVVLRGQCRENEHLSYNAFDGVVDDLSRHLARMSKGECAALLPADMSQLARLFPVLRRVAAVEALGRPDVLEGAEEARRFAFVALRNLLATLAQTTPILVLVEGWQWADADSALLLSEVFPREHWPENLALCVSVRAHSGEVPFANRPNVRRILLGPLGEDDSLELAEQVWASLSSSPPDDKLGALVRSAAGNPTLLTDLVYHRATRPDSLASSIEEMAAERLALLSPEEHRVLDAVVASLATASTADVAEVTGLTPAEVRATIGRLKAKRFVRSASGLGGGAVEPHPPHVAALVTRSWSKDYEVTLHTRWASALAQRDAEPELQLAHLLRTSDDERAGQVALRAARAAEDALAFERAVALHETAIRLLRPEGAERIAALDHWARALAAAGRAADSARVCLEACDTATGVELATFRRRAAGQLAISGRMDDGVAIFRVALAEAGVRYPGSTLETLLTYLWLRLRLRLRGLRATWRETGDIATADAQRMALVGIVGRVLGTLNPMLGSVFELRELLLALRLGDRRRATMALSIHAAKQAALSKFALADKLLATADSWRTPGDEPLARWIVGFRHMIGYISGRMSEAAVELRWIAEHWMHIGVGLATTDDADIFATPHGANWARTVELGALRNLGRFRALREHGEEYFRDAERRGDRYLQSIVGLGANIATLLYEGPEAARARYDASRFESTGTIHSPHWYGVRALAEIDLFGSERAPWTKHHDALREVRRSLVARTNVWSCDLDFLEGRLALAEHARSNTPSPRMLEHARRCARRLVGSGLSYGRTWGALLEALRHARLDERDAALRSLELCLREAAAREHEVIVELAAFLRSQLLGADVDAARARLDAWAREQELESPAGVLRVFAPGGDRSGGAARG